MSQFTARCPTPNEEQEMQYFAISEIGKDFKFYIPTPGFEKSGMAFRVAYAAAQKSSNDKELCAYVGSMLCAVSSDLRNSVVEALHGVDVEPRFVELPSQARAFGIDEAQVHQMDWHSIIVNFACICTLVLKNNTDNQKFMSRCINELRRRVGLKPIHLTEWSAPFDSSRAYAIRTMLGASLTLRASMIKLIIGNMNQGPASIRGVCQYLFDIISWSRMDELVCLNKMLLAESSALSNPKFSCEVENLREAFAAIQSHLYPQFFMHLASNEELLKVDQSRFPKLIDIARQRIVHYR